MGYTTTFKGRFNLNKALDDVTFNFLKKLNNTRRMKRNVAAVYGVEGEFYVDGGDHADSTVVNGNQEPRTQPGLWCGWTPTDDRMGIEWDGAEKFYNYIEWITYIVSKVLAPRGYVLNGDVKWRGEEFDDIGTLEIHDNVVMGKRVIVDYSINKLLGQVGAATAGNKNHSPAVSTNKRQVGVRPDGKKTKHMIYKEKQLQAEQALKDQIALLEKQLKEKDAVIQQAKASEKKTSKMSVKDLMLEKIRNQAGFGGNLEDFKAMLHNLLK